MLLTALALLGSLTQAPAPAALPAQLAARDVRIVVQASSSHLVAENHAATPQLLLFSEPSVGFRAARLLAPGERASFALPEGLAPGFRMEAFDGATPASRSTGSFAVDDVRAHTDTMIVGVGAEQRVALLFVEGAAEVELATGPSLYPALAHVPAPIPSVDRRPATRRIERRPLPPV
jgi:hypothetical protein